MQLFYLMLEVQLLEIICHFNVKWMVFFRTFIFVTEGGFFCLPKYLQIYFSLQYML